jgi:hypothetical protein
MVLSKPGVGFIGIGAQKCASTWLHDVLVDHPQLSMPTEVKEVDYFSYHHQRGPQWYEQRFDAIAQGTLCGEMCGEISPSYMHTPDVVTRVAEYNPDMRIILIARDPIARAISNHKHELRIGNIQGDDMSFEFGLRNNEDYIEQGLYAKHLENWQSRFPVEQFLVLKFDDVVTDPAKALAVVCEFLGVDSAYESPQVESRSNISYLNRSAGVDKLKNAMRSVLRSIGLGGLWQRLGDSGLRDNYRRANRLEPDSVIAPPQADTLLKLKEIFRPDLKRFESMTGLSTADWLQQTGCSNKAGGD